MYTTASKKCKKLNSLLHFIYLFFFPSIYVDVSFRYLQPTHIEKKYACILSIFKRNNFVNLHILILA